MTQGDPVPSVFDLILRRVRYLPEPCPDARLTALTRRPDPDAPPKANPVPTAPPRPSEPLPIGQVWPSPQTWRNAELTEAEEVDEERVLATLATLTDQLGDPLAAAQHEFAPHLLEDHQ